MINETKEEISRLITVFNLLFSKPKSTLIISCLIAVFSNLAKAQAPLTGHLYDSDGVPLSYATIYVKQTESGTTTNMEGFYSLLLAPGTYTIIYQYLGYSAQEKTVEIRENHNGPLDIIMEPETIVLRPVEVLANREDPAYTIMRKAIAKSKFHLQQLDSYSARVYTKGSGRLIDSPFFLRKTLAKEGIDSTFTFVSESISDISYQRPNTFTERVISVRTSGEDNNTSPNSYITGSFYEPTIADAISPLSPKAFAYYRFEYLGTFIDRDYAVSKIRVIPRSKGDDVFSGIISIVEDYWSIYSLDLSTTKLGIEFNVKQIYNPINELAWLPVSHQFEINGTFLGFDFEYKYLATVSDYKIELNPDLNIELNLVDEKVEKELAEEISKLTPPKTASVQEQLVDGKEITRKDLRKIINAYEKDEQEATDEPNVIENFAYSIDSLAANSDSSYWASARPVPLTDREVLGYHKMDSLAIVEREKDEGDTLKSGKRQGFHVQDIVLGNSYRFKNDDYLRYYSPLESLNFNTVEGYNFNVRFRFVKTWESKNRLELMPIVRYSFSRGVVNGKATAQYTYARNTLRQGSVAISGGKFTHQLNGANPIHPLVNSITTLMLKSNYMKIFEEGFIALNQEGKLADNLGYNIEIKWSELFNLENTTSHTWIKQDKEYSSNNPQNAEVNDTSFPYHHSFTGSFTMQYQPWLKYRIKYERKRPIESSSPTFSLTYKKAIANSIGDTDYDYLETGVNHNFKIGIRGRLGFDLSAGKFLRSENMYFTDFKHFMGNESPFLLDNPVGSYRLLSYYNYSTRDQFFSGITYYQFRKFLFTQLPLLRMTGVKEIVFMSFLATPYSNNYFELGYGIDNLFRVLRLEAAASFEGGRYSGWGLKIGIATSITSDGNNMSFGF